MDELEEALRRRGKEEDKRENVSIIQDVKVRPPEKKHESLAISLAVL